jgi:hypothetical protein
MKKAMTLLPVICLGWMAIFLGACASFGGPLKERSLPPPSRTLDPETAVTPPWPTPAPLAAHLKRLYLASQPESAEVYIDKRYRGLTPLVLPDQPFGQYYVEIVKHGYRTLGLWIDYHKNQEECYWTLEREKGILEISVQPAEAEVMIGGRTLVVGANALPAGTHSVTVRAFGYLGRTAEAVVRPDETTRLEISLARMPFAIHSLSLSRSLINPERPGPAASVALFFSVTGPGSATIEVRDPADHPVARLELRTLTTETQCVVWNGRDEAGRTLADGAYRILLSGTGAEGRAEAAAETTVRIDATLALEHQSLWSGVSGLMYAPSPTVLPASDYEISAVALAGLTDFPSLSTPLVLGGRIGLGSGHEVDASLGTILSGESTTTIQGSAAWKYQWLGTTSGSGLAAALFAKLTYHYGYRGDLFSNPTAVSIGVPARLCLGPFSIYAAVECCLALYRVSDDPATAPVPGAYPWLYSRAGISFTEGILTAGISTACRTRPFGEGLALAPSVPTALEIACYIPESSVYLSLTGVVEWTAVDWRGWAGFGFGLMW